MKRTAKPDKEEVRKNIDRKWAELFVILLNGQGTDYKLTKHAQIPGWADIDAQAESPTGKFVPLYIQFVEDKQFEGIVHGAKFFSGGNNHVMEHIRAKHRRYTSQGVRIDNHTLVVQVPSIIEGDSEYRYPEEMRAECKSLGFKAIYLLSPKSISMRPRSQDDNPPARIIKLA